MLNHYNAFISYKHAPEDNRVAEAVHKGLERFHIPGKLRKKTGFKRINRIFRDKDELPITNDLSDTIANALENSDYLIVICSTNTKESAWVPREIEYFLKNHTKKDIFTVLVNGEPYDVIPKILLYDDRVVNDENGNEQTVRMPIEPLSCDYRIGIGKAKKTELPRLASGLIGCAYDELMNRHRQYRLKQITACFACVLAVALSFCGYMYYSRNKIHKNYLESLKNQSKYLANESVKLLDKEQRITALQLALAALPQNDQDDRPVTAEAVKALTDATLAYVGNDGSNINAEWNYRMPNTILDYEVSKDGNTIAVLDSSSLIGVWNTNTHEKIMYFDDMEDVAGIAFLNDNSLAIWSDQRLVCYDISSKSELWNYTLENSSFKDNKNYMLTDDSVIIGTGEGNYLELNLTTGKLEKEIPITLSDECSDLGVVASELSPDGKKIAFYGLVGWNNYAFGILDIASKKTDMSGLKDETIKDISWSGNDKLMVAGSVVDMTSSMGIGSADIISSDHTNIECINAADLSEKWKADFVCNGVMINRGFVNLSNDTVGYYSGNVFTAYELSTGKEKYSNNVNDSIVDVSDKDGDGTPVYITENGGYATPAPQMDADAVYYNRYFTDELCQVKLNNGAYVRQDISNEVIYYGVHVYDDAWTLLSDSVTLSDISREFCLDENSLAVLANDANGPVLALYDLAEGGEAFTVRLQGDNNYNYKVLGICGGRIYLGYNNIDSYDILSVDISGNELKNEEQFKMSASFENSCIMRDGKLIYYYRDDDYKNMLAIYDINNANRKDIALPDDIGYIKHAPKYYEKENVVYIVGDTEYAINIESGNADKIDVPDGWAGALAFSDSSSEGVAAVSDGKQISIVNLKSFAVKTIRCPGVKPIGMAFSDSELMVLYSDGGLDWYEKNSGEFVKKSDASVYYNFDGEAAFDFDRDNNLIYIQMDVLTDVIDMESGVEIAHIDNCFGHHMGRDIFITSAKESNKNVKVGYYKRYSVNELIDKAKGILQNTDLSPELKSRYGIEQ